MHRTTSDASPSNIRPRAVRKHAFGGDVPADVSGVAGAFPGGRAAHPEDQDEEENEENLRKNEKNYRKMGKD